MLNLFQHNMRLWFVILKRVQDDDMVGSDNDMVGRLVDREDLAHFAFANIGAR
jgi:hypothetical protein